MRMIHFLTGFILVVGLFSCKKHNANKIEPDEEYIAYINSDSIQTDLIPLDIVKTPDEGFLILGSSPSTALFHKTYVLKVDKGGKYQWDTYLDLKFLNPVSEILTRNGEFFIFCMDEVTGTHLVRLNPVGGKGESVNYWGNILLPLHANFTPDGGYLILNANLGDKWTGFTKIDANMSTTWTRQYTFEETFAANIDRHVKRESPPLPFFCGTTLSGSTASSYYFNAFYGANISCRFVSPSTGRVTGFSYLGGDRSYAAVRTLLQLNDDKFAISWHDRSSINFLVPNYAMTITAPIPTAVTELGGQKFADMEVDSRIVCKKVTLAGRAVILYAANTKNNGVALYTFDSNTGDYISSKTLSLETPFELGGFALSSDGGLVVMVKTYIANRFARVGLIKLSEEEMKPLVGM